MDSTRDDDVTLWEVALGSIGGASMADPDEAEDADLLEAAWAAAHTSEEVADWTPLRVRAEQSPPPAVLYVEEAEVLVYADAVRTAVQGVEAPASHHDWLPVVVEADDAEHRYWVLSCRVPDVELADGRVDGARARDAAVVHYRVGDGFPAFSDDARRAIEAAVPGVVLERADTPRSVPGTPD